MSILAMASPVSLPSKVMLAFVALLLMAFLIQHLTKRTCTLGSFLLAAGAAIVGVILLEFLIPGPFRFFWHDRGFLAAVVGLFCGTFLTLSIPQSEEGIKGAPVSYRKLLQLAGLALLAGIALPLLLVLTAVLLKGDSLTESFETLKDVSFLSLLAGTVGALLFLFVGAVVGRWQWSAHNHRKFQKIGHHSR